MFQTIISTKDQLRTVVIRQYMESTWTTLFIRSEKLVEAWQRSDSRGVKRQALFLSASHPSNFTDQLNEDSLGMS